MFLIDWLVNHHSKLVCRAMIIALAHTRFAYVALILLYGADRTYIHVKTHQHTRCLSSFEQRNKCVRIYFLERITQQNFHSVICNADYLNNFYWAK